MTHRPLPEPVRRRSLAELDELDLEVRALEILAAENEFAETAADEHALETGAVLLMVAGEVGEYRDWMFGLLPLRPLPKVFPGARMELEPPRGRRRAEPREPPFASWHPVEDVRVVAQFPLENPLDGSAAWRTRALALRRDGELLTVDLVQKVGAAHTWLEAVRPWHVDDWRRGPGNESLVHALAAAVNVAIERRTETLQARMRELRDKL